ncbi:ABC transporter permease [Anaerobranca gottschalkii]|uniref:MacB-like core domain-containing protein n=1 Tax=Anaerobranca gottschalkii DSM 13577 TaxID=1120990 RepID=A0A1H9YDG3_9FIRM|nr:FtsX-like permease family protein [Anaerobranca gottschalkii]SES66982.1 MacB-like core domain-containing protein [Anaerobranca gottschalkii DSM 13577]
MNKAVLYIRTCLLYIIKNKVRFTLTVSGMVLACFLLTFGYVFIDSYYESNFTRINDYKRTNSIVVTGQMDITTMNNINNLVGGTYASYQRVPGSYIIYSSNNKNINVEIILTNANFTDFLVPVEELSSTTYFKTYLVKGRSIELEDILNGNRVVVIDSVLEYLLFGDHDSIGKYLYIPIREFSNNFSSLRYEPLQIIGVIEASDDSKQKYYEFNKNSSQINTVYNGRVFVPYSIDLFSNYDDMEASSRFISLVYSYLPNYEATFTALDTYLRDYNHSVSAHSYKSIYRDIEFELIETRKTLYLGVLLIIIFSGICIMNTMFFSVKERINEIGIRKSCGASDEDIVIQFIIEGLLYGIIAAIIGIFLALVLVSLVIIYLQEAGYYALLLVIKPSSILISLLTSLVISLIASIIPAIYGSRIKIVDAVRFD